MILDRLVNYKRYPLGPAWEQALQFLQTLNADSPVGRHELLPDGQMFAMIMEYPAQSKDKGKPEAHNKYIDIQCTLAGAEGMYIYDRHEMKVQVPYNNTNDVEFYEQNSRHEHFVAIFPGEFAVFFNSDAHMPQMAVAGQELEIRKVVVKVRKDLLRTV